MISTNFSLPLPSLDRILDAHTTGAPFSVDLVAAAKHQTELVARISELGWLSEDRFKKDETMLYLAVARYIG